MAKYKKQTQPSSETIDEALGIAKSIQRPNQTKEQTKIIAQGIEKGISEYKKRQKVKAREQDKQKKRIDRAKNEQSEVYSSEPIPQKSQSQWLPWGLLVLSWIGMGYYCFIQS